MGKPSKGKESGSANVRLSKQLTQILRHSGRSEGLAVRPDGYAFLEEVLKLPSMAKLKATDQDIREIVKTSDKQRFALLEDDGGRALIRANQGHSMEGIDMDELCGEPILDLEDGEVCCHGTYESHFDSILRRGLLAGGSQGQTFRRHVHFSIRPPGETVISGMRQNCQIAIYVDLSRAAREGVRFYRSANNVILSEGVGGAVPPAYIDRVWHIQKKIQLYPPTAALALRGAALQSPAGELRCALQAYAAYRRGFCL